MAEGFPEILSRLRKERKLNQRTAAAALNISQALLSHYENGLREPGLAFVDAACSFYGVSADYLLGRSALRTPPPGGALSPALLEIIEAMAQTSDSLIRALQALGDRETEEDLRDYIALLLYGGLRPYDAGSETGPEAEQNTALCAAARQLLLARLLARRPKGAEAGLCIELPEALKAPAEAELNVLRDEWR